VSRRRVSRRPPFDDGENLFRGRFLRRVNQFAVNPTSMANCARVPCFVKCIIWGFVLLKYSYEKPFRSERTMPSVQLGAVKILGMAIPRKSNSGALIGRTLVQSSKTSSYQRALHGGSGDGPLHDAAPAHRDRRLSQSTRVSIRTCARGIERTSAGRLRTQTRKRSPVSARPSRPRLWRG